MKIACMQRTWNAPVLTAATFHVFSHTSALKWMMPCIFTLLPSEWGASEKSVLRVDQYGRLCRFSEWGSEIQSDEKEFRGTTKLKFTHVRCGFSKGKVLQTVTPIISGQLYLGQPYLGWSRSDPATYLISDTSCFLQLLYFRHSFNWKCVY